MQTILDFTKEIVDEICKYKKEFTLTIMPDKIRIIDHYEEDDWTVIRDITFSNDLFNVLTNYGGHVDNINETQFKTIKEAVDFIFN